MSNRMNHSKLNMQKRIAYESRWDASDPGFWDSPSYEDSFKWRVIYLKKHKGKTLPEILAVDPGYVIGFLYTEDVLFKPLLSRAPSGYQMAVAHQLEALANRAKHILLPNQLRKTHQFVVIIDADGVFKSVKVIPKGKIPKDLPAGSKIVKLQELDLSIPYHHANPKLGMERMGKCFRKIFFDGKLSPTAEQCQEFFFDDTNFNLKNCISHTSFSCSLQNHELLTGRIGVEH